MNDIKKVIDKYKRVEQKRLPGVIDFHNGDRPYLVCVSGPATFYTQCNTIEQSFNANINDFNIALDFSSDTIPYLEPWFGTGTYAQAFGSEYLWREGESPACHYKYHNIEEVRDIVKPDIKDGHIFKMVLDAIAYFRDKTQSSLPMCITDTQSAHDSATLILDAVEVFTASYSDPELLHGFLDKINRLIVEFTHAQIDALGECLVKPGHIMSATANVLKGISISDDNLAVGSPMVNEKFMLPYDDKLGETFGGVAIHSCGNWAHTMPIIARSPFVNMIDCAISPDIDPNPNDPALVREAFKGTNKIVQVRIGGDVDENIEYVKQICDKDIRLVVRVSGNVDKNQSQYDTVNSFLKKFYGI